MKYGRVAGKCESINYKSSEEISRTVFVDLSTKGSICLDLGIDFEIKWKF